jgi:hypothetical protein
MYEKQGRRRTYDVAFRRVHVKYFPLETTKHSVSIVVVVVVVVVDQHVIVNNIKILSVAQQCFYGKFVSPTTMKIIRINFLKETLSQLIFTLSDIAHKHGIATNE